MDMSDTAAVVTGHTRGLGEAVAASLLARGVRVLSIARGSNAELAARHGAALREVELDLSDPGKRGAWLRDADLEGFLAGAGTALLVNNAGLLEPIGPLGTQDQELVTRAVEVNVAAPLALSAAFAAVTARARERRILHISSGAGRHAYAGWAVYCATKAALDHHARAVALDHSARLRISSVAPGVIDTEMQTQIRASTEALFPDRQRFVELKEEGRLIGAAEAGAAVVEFLLSDAFGREPVSEIRYRRR